MINCLSRFKLLFFILLLSLTFFSSNLYADSSQRVTTHKLYEYCKKDVSEFLIEDTLCGSYINGVVAGYGMTAYLFISVIENLSLDKGKNKNLIEYYKKIISVWGCKETEVPLKRVAEEFLFYVENNEAYALKNDPSFFFIDYYASCGGPSLLSEKPIARKYTYGSAPD